MASRYQGKYAAFNDALMKTSGRITSESIRVAAQTFLEDPLGEPLIPNWNRVQSALPKFLGELNEAVCQDNAD